MNWLLLAMQAAGMVTDFLGTRNQADFYKIGMQLQQAGLEANIESTRAESANESLQAMINLRKTLGSQIAGFAARGTSTAGGNAAILLNESQAAFNADEKIRRLNLLGKENQLRGQAALSRLQYSSDVSKLWQGFASRTFNLLPTNLSNLIGGRKSDQGFGLSSI